MQTPQLGDGFGSDCWLQAGNKAFGRYAQKNGVLRGQYPPQGVARNRKPSPEVAYPGDPACRIPAVFANNRRCRSIRETPGQARCRQNALPRGQRSTAIRKQTVLLFSGQPLEWRLLNDALNNGMEEGEDPTAVTTIPYRLISRAYESFQVKPCPLPTDPAPTPRAAGSKNLCTAETKFPA